MSSQEWKIEKLGTIANFKTGKLNSNASDTNGTYPFFTCSPITYKINNFAFDCEAIILAGNNANGVFSLKYYKGKFNAYQRTYVITINPTFAIPKFIFYYLDLSLNRLKNISHGTATKYLTLPLLFEINILLPPLPTQRRIADILSALDDKIELNRRTNATLEAIAQAIFKEWFVDFNYPGATGELVDSELGRIPKGWRVGRLGELVKIISGKGLHKDSIKESGIPVFGANGLIGYTDTFLLNEEVILTGRVGTLGTFQLVDGKAWISDNVLIIKPNTKSIYYFSYFGIKNINFRNLNRGSTQPLITKTDLLNQQLVIPDILTLQGFDMVIRALFSCIGNNKDESATLATIRDALLPKLMSRAIVL